MTIEKLKEILVNAMNASGNFAVWEKVRELYFWNSYAIFLSLSICSVLGNKEKNPLSKAVKIGLIENEIRENLLTKVQFNEIYSRVKNDADCDLNDLYQFFSQLNFCLFDEKFFFKQNKFERDVLGAYYTSEKFAEKIIEKTILNYFEVDEVSQIQKKNIVDKKVLDPSCGSASFLCAYVKWVYRHFELDDHEKEMLILNLYGMDVDPIAILIARTRICLVSGQLKSFPKICLGNPLVYKRVCSSVDEKLYFSARGRFYNENMSIDFGGIQFDLIFGNPPWKKIRFEEKKFIASYCSDLENKGNRLEHNQFLLNEIDKENRNFLFDYKADYENYKKNARLHPMLKDSLHGEINTCALFLELSDELVNFKSGMVSLIVKSSILFMPTHKILFKKILNSKRIQEICFFKNTKKIFDIDSREEFAVVFLKQSRTFSFDVKLNLTEISEIDSAKSIRISKNILKKINPLTELLPNVPSEKELDFLIKSYNNHPCFDLVYPNCRYGRLVHFTNHIRQLSSAPSDKNLPVYEGKFIELYTAKFSTFKNMSEQQRFKNKASSVLISNIEGSEYPESRYYIDKKFWSSLSKKFSKSFIVAWRSLTSSTNSRTTLATLLPFMPTSQSIQFLQNENRNETVQILALFNSFIFDYFVRNKLVGLDLTQTVLKQIPVPDRCVYEQVVLFGGVSATLQEHLNSRVRKIYENDARMKPFFENMKSIDFSGKNRKDLIEEIDSLISIGYGFSEAQLNEIKKTFAKSM